MIPMEIIATIRSDFPTKFGIPRQSGLVEELRATVVFRPEYRSLDALWGLEDFSHLWLIWQFSEAVRDKWSPTVQPPGWGATPAWGCSPPARPSGPTPSACPACGWRASGESRSWAACWRSPGPI